DDVRARPRRDHPGDRGPRVHRRPLRPLERERRPGGPGLGGAGGRRGGGAALPDAAAAQMKDLGYFSGYVGSSNIPAITLANKLIELAYDNMQAVFFTCGGAESNESAFKTARFYWKTQGKPDKVKIISRQQGYHGVTLQAMSATGMGAYWKMFEPRVPGFVHIQTCYPYRFQGAKPGETVGQAAARELEEAILREGPDTV